MYRAFLRERLVVGQARFFPPATPKEIAAVQEELGLASRSLPVDYTDFLSDAGGFMWNGLIFFGASSSLPPESTITAANRIFGWSISEHTPLLGRMKPASTFMIMAMAIRN